MVKNATVHKFMGVVVFVRREKLTTKSIVDVRDGPQVECETRRIIQTGTRALGHIIDEISSTENGDVQVGVFVFYEADISDIIVGTITADGFIRSFHLEKFLQGLCCANPYD